MSLEDFRAKLDELRPTKIIRKELIDMYVELMNKNDFLRSCLISISAFIPQNYEVR